MKTMWKVSFWMYFLLLTTFSQAAADKMEFFVYVLQFPFKLLQYQVYSG